MERKRVKRLAYDVGAAALSYGVKRLMNRSGRKTGPKRRRIIVGSRRSLYKRRVRAYNTRRQPRLTNRYVKKKIKKMCRFMKQQTAIHVRRTRDTGKGICNQNVTGTAVVNIGGKISDIESAMATLRFFDPATNTLVTAPGATGTYSRDISLSISRTFTMKNNYHIPVHMELYSCTPKDATNLNAYDVYLSGLVDQGNPLNSSNLVRFTDSQDLKNVWTVKKVCDKIIMPGRSCVARHFSKEFQYKLATADEQGLTYQKSQGGHNWVFRLRGVLSHDSVVLTQQGFSEGAVDYCVDNVYTFKYDAGKDLHDISVVDNSSTFTNIPIVSNQPLVAQQAYRVAP